jgi:hypothetical protein
VADRWNPAAVSPRESNGLGLKVNRHRNVASRGEGERVSPFTGGSLVVALGR